MSHSFWMYLRLLRYARPYKGKLVISTLAMIGVAAMTALSALIIKNVLDDVFIAGDRQLLLLIPVVIIAIYILKGIFRYVRTYVMSWAGLRMVQDIRNELYEHMHRMSLSFFTETPTGVLMSRVTYDVNMMQNAVTEAFVGAFRDVFTILGLAIVVFYRNAQLGMIALVGFPLAFYPLVRFGRKMKKASRRSQEQVGSLNKLMQEKISGAGLIKASGTEAVELDEFKHQNEKLVKSFLKIERVKALSNPVMEFIGALSVSFIIWIGGLTVINGKMTVGEFFSFLAAIMMLYEPVKHITSVNNIIQQGLAAAERVFEILDISPGIDDAPDAVDIPRSSGHITFKGVSFRYGDEYVLKDIDLDIPSGTKLAIVGTSGGGKTTLVNLIPRFYDVTEGKITVDGYDIKQVTQKSLREQISIVSQEVVLFNDTIGSNICYGMTDVSEADLEEALKTAYALDFVKSLSEGYNTIIGERGARLSGGQRQRISIARALLKNSPILILDEATSALDTESEHLVQKALENLVKGRTTLTIAHRISTVKDADRIIVISQGRIVESGHHEELIDLGGEYSRLYSLLVEENPSDDPEAKED
ncbi:MAG: lipid A export permease/ATP-binding protein MsbA [bacterium]|nr:lipid A export permease/ATP-binding protein MsbA [bacterium]MDT8365307.1 lipid A export permease/ATP-binding protein MsbA [bacterium]